MNQKHQAQFGVKSSRHKNMPRRQLLKTLGAGTVAAASGIAQNRFSIRAINSPVAQRVSEFALSDIRLLAGPFLQAQQRDAKYLLQLEPDRMLHNFRVNAGLQPKAAVYGGWESVEPWIDIRCHGHTLGHYLTACALMFAATGDQQFKQRVDYIVAELRECQEAGKTGLICAFPDGAAPLNAILNTKRFVGVPWYTMHKIFAGLRDAYLHTKNQTALDVLIKLSDWAITHTQNLTEEQFQRMLGTEHGGMSEVLADVYAITGEKRFLTLAQRFCHQALLDPLAQKRDTLTGLHSNTQIPKVIGFQRLYELTGQENYTVAAKFFWQTIIENRTFATGGNGDKEHFFAPTEFAQRLSSAKTMETCCTYNMLKLTRSLFSQNPSANYVDYYERALYNSILASQDPESGMMTYFQPTRPGYLKLYCTPTDSFWCCTGSGMENHAKYGDSIYFRGENSLYVNLFIPSTLNWKEKGFSLTQLTKFPEQDKTRLQLTLQKPRSLTLNLRHPSWCLTASVYINGHRHATSQKAGSFIAINRVWRSGDVIELRVPMTLRTEALPGQADIVAILYGPIVLAEKMGQEGIQPGADIIVNERTYGDVLKAAIEVPTFSSGAQEMMTHLKPVANAPLTFQTNKIGRPRDVELIPYYRIAHERYNLYWKINQHENTDKKKA